MSCLEFFIHVVGRSVASIYHVFFKNIDWEKTRKLNEKLTQDVKISWPHLLETNRGVITTNTDRIKPSFDYAIAFVEFSEMTLRVVRGRGELRLSVRSNSSSEEWLDLNVVPTCQAEEFRNLRAADLVKAESLLKICWNEIILIAGCTRPVT